MVPRTVYSNFPHTGGSQQYLFREEHLDVMASNLLASSRFKENPKFISSIFCGLVGDVMRVTKIAGRSRKVELAKGRL